MHPFVIRAATAQDSAAILTCLGQAFEPYRAQYTPDAFADTVLSHGTIHQRLQAMCVYVADAGGHVIGTVGYEMATPEEGHIRGMAMLPEYAGKGVAAALLGYVEDAAKAAGAKRVTLDTTRVLLPARRFYEKHGFRATGVVGDFFGMELHEFAKEL